MSSDLIKALRAQVAFDTTKAHREICDLAAGKRRWEMCIPPQASDSDMTLQAPLDHLARLTPILSSLIAVVEANEKAYELICSQHYSSSGISKDINKALDWLYRARADLRAAVGMET